MFTFYKLAKDYLALCNMKDAVWAYKIFKNLEWSYREYEIKGDTIFQKYINWESIVFL
jgi:hypothetical protein